MVVANSTEQHRRVPGRPFQKGRSGNPSGRPVVVRDFRDKCREFMETGGGWEALIDLTQSGRDQFVALSLIASYAYGKPTQPISGPDGEAVNQTFTFTIQTPGRDET